MSGFDHIIIGAGLGGAWLTLRVLLEGKRDVDSLTLEISACRSAIERCRAEMAEKTIEAEQLETSVKTLKEEIARLEGERGDLDREIQDKKAKLDPQNQTRFRVGGQKKQEGGP